MTAPTPSDTAAEVETDSDTDTPVVDRAHGAVVLADDRLILPVEGDLDLYTAPDLAQRLCPLAAQGGHLTLDLSGLSSSAWPA